MLGLSARQRELVEALSSRLAAVSGVCAVVLGGSHARGRARPDSDIDLGLFYSEAAPFSISAIRELACSVNDTPDPVVTDFYDWGEWVNGGSWLTIAGQRVDFLYRSLEQVERVIASAEAGGHELCYGQHAPFGFFSGTYLGEVDVCMPIFHSDDHLLALKRRVSTYPDALRRAVVQDYLWGADFELEAFAPKFAKRGDTYGTAACLTRTVNQLILVLFALNRRYLLNDKTALAEIAEFERAPESFGPRIQRVLGKLGSEPEELEAAIAALTTITRETIELCEGLYRPRFIQAELQNT